MSLAAPATPMHGTAGAFGTRPVDDGPNLAERRPRAEALGRAAADDLLDAGAVTLAIRLALEELADPSCRAAQEFIAPGIGPTAGVRSPLLTAFGRGFRAATRLDSPTALLFVADRLLGDPVLEARWIAFGILDRTLAGEPERTWQLLRRAGREAADWITVDSLAHPMSHGILAEPYRWAELEQLTYSRSRWERRLVGSTIATMPFLSRGAGRRPQVAEQGLQILGQLIGDAEPDVQKALAWAYRSMTIVDLAATTGALAAEADRAAATDDGQRAWVIRDAAGKLEAAAAAAIRDRLVGIRRRGGAPSTSTASAAAARFRDPDLDLDVDLGLGGPMPQPPLT